MFRLLLLISLIHRGHAIQCSEATATINSVCEGDLCYQVGSGASRGCISGMKYLNEGCYFAQFVEFFVCLCRSDFCNLYLLDASASKSVSNVSWGNRSFPITIYSSITCNSNNLNSLSSINGQFCSSNGVLNKTTSAYSVVLSDETSFADGLFGIHPPAYLTSTPTPFYFGGYYSFQTNSQESSAYQLCNWDVCNENGYTPSSSTNLQCFMSGSTDGETCQGQYCFIQITVFKASKI
ncbi:unnamed protein product, partial [Mesorhabditis belari]|uniref:Uncharacterized protein n=1 Tax=Mesorhabditis belari TaxID=2138241 RepID=A0AAF3E7V2_9BILA